MRPREMSASWGPRGRGADIAYGIVDSPLGRMLVAVTERGICALSLHRSDRWQVRELKRDFREARIRHDPAAVRPAVKVVLGYLRGKSKECDFPWTCRVHRFSSGCGGNCVLFASVRHGVTAKLRRAWAAPPQRAPSVVRLVRTRFQS